MTAPNILYNDIRPYTESEIQDVITTLVDDPEFQYVIANFAPQIDLKQLKVNSSNFNTVLDFQKALVVPIIESLIDKLCTSFTPSGTENLQSYGILMSNHRDIVIDPTFLCYALISSNYNTCEIGIGDNLLKRPWIQTLVRLNKSFIVRRDLKPKELAKALTQLSGYINHTIKDNNNHVWIAQREGRAKDSNDRTQESIIKMFALGGTSSSLIENIKQLNIHPTCISYEYDPCDYLKAKEMQQRRDNPDFKKSPQDDLTSMQTGILGFKGNIHYAFTPCINPKIEQIESHNLNRKEQCAEICRICDEQIWNAYKIYPINMIAHDLLHNNKQFADKYTPQQAEEINKYLNNQLNKIDLDNPDKHFLMECILKMYANPLINQLSVR